MKAVLTVIVSVILSIAASTAYLSTKTGDHKPDASAYDRVMGSKTLRCGYALWPPVAIYKNPNTGELGGIFPDIINEAAKRLGLKVEWVEETGWTSFAEGLQSKRFDLMCAAAWQNAERGSRLSYTVPIAYSALHFYTRAGDTRFDKNINLANDSGVKLATMDGEMSQIVARRFFPKAQEVAISQIGDVSQLLLNVTTGKADGVFVDPSMAKDYAIHNPGKIHQATTLPYQIFPNVYFADINEGKLISMLNSALIEIQNLGIIDAIVEKHEPDRSIFMPVAKLYQYIAPAPLP